VADAVGALRLTEAQSPSDACAHFSALDATQAAQDALMFTRCATARLLNLLDPARSPVIVVRIKAAGALANVADFGVPASSSAAAAASTDATHLPNGHACLSVHELLPSALYLQLVDRVVAATSDNEKILSNAVRGLGNLARGFPLPAATGAAVAVQHPSALFLRMLSTLLTSLSSSRSPKSRWNCCHALGNAFRNPQLPTLWRSDAQAAQMARRALVQLLAVMQDAPLQGAGGDVASRALLPAGKAESGGSKLSNFKVRIQAAAALSAPPSRAHFGSSFALVLRTLLSLCESLVASSSLSAAPVSGADLSSFQDFKYREQLRAQVLSSLVAVLGMEDAHEGAGALIAEEGQELEELYLANSALLARLLLAERLRLEKERKELDRIVAGTARPRLMARGAKRSTAAASPTPATAPATGAKGAAALTASGMSRHAIEQATAAVERAATAVEGVLRALESYGSGPQQLERAGMAARFASEANGEQPGTPRGAGVEHGLPAVSPPRMAL